MSRPVLVLPSPPTANGDLHLGHLAGPYLAADAFARYRRMCGDDVAYVTGADVHQSYVARMAERNATSPAATADIFADRIEKTLHAADVEVNAFVRPHRSQIYQRFVRDFFRRLADGGHLVDEERPLLWCESCNRYLMGVAARGACGSCGLETDGALCEHCGRPVEGTTLRDPSCTACGSRATLRPLRRLFFSVDAFADRLREYHFESRMRSRSKQIVDALLADRLFDSAITTPSGWGVPVPTAGFERQRLEVWAEVGAGYPASTAELTASQNEDDGWRRYWSSENAEIVQFFGFDNTVPHTLLYPALYFAHGGIRPPDRFVINQFHRLDGEKFSTSRGHAVWGGDALAHVAADGLRYYLSLTAPEDEQGNFSLSNFKETVNHDLAGTIGPFLDGMLRIAASSRSLAARNEDPALIAELRIRTRELGRALEPETFSLRALANGWREMATSIGKHFAFRPDGSRDRQSDPHRPSIMDALSLLAGCAYPLMPSFAERLWGAIGAAGDLRTHRWGEYALLFDRNVTPPPTGTWFPELTDADLRPSDGEPVGA